ncbi:MAG: type II CAAX endopeptidase family protein [Candidatus Hadarchaeota archaeon]
MKKRPSVLLPILLFLIYYSTLHLLAWYGVDLEQPSALTAVVLTLFYYPFMFACLVIFNGFQGFTLKDLGFKRVKGWPRLALLGVILGAVSSLSLMALFGLFRWAGLVSVLSLPATETPAVVMIATLLITFEVLLVLAAVEEAAFRGYIQRIFKLRYGYLKSLIVASLLFAMAHFSFVTIIKVWQLLPGATWSIVQVQLINAFLGILPAGFFFGYIYFKTRQNLICPISFHATHNFFLILTQTLLNSFVSLTFLTSPGWSIFILLLWVAVVWSSILLLLNRFKIKGKPRQ